MRGRPPKALSEAVVIDPTEAPGSLPEPPASLNLDFLEISEAQEEKPEQKEEKEEKKEEKPTLTPEERRELAEFWADIGVLGVKTIFNYGLAKALREPELAFGPEEEPELAEWADAFGTFMAKHFPQIKKTDVYEDIRFITLSVVLFAPKAAVLARHFSRPPEPALQPEAPAPEPRRRGLTLGELQGGGQ